MYEIAVIAMLN